MVSAGGNVGETGKLRTSQSTPGTTHSPIPAPERHDHGPRQSHAVQPVGPAKSQFEGAGRLILPLPGPREAGEKGAPTGRHPS